mgnify:CR=1 FL=1
MSTQAEIDKRKAEDDEISRNLKIGGYVVMFHNDFPKRDGREYSDLHPPPPSRWCRIVEIHDLRTLTLQPLERGPAYEIGEASPPAVGQPFERVPRFDMDMPSRHNTWQPVV